MEAQCDTLALQVGPYLSVSICGLFCRVLILHICVTVKKRDNMPDASIKPPDHNKFYYIIEKNEFIKILYKIIFLK